MLFNSIHFFIFFPIVTCAYFALVPRYRWVLLLLASAYFYMAFIPAYLLVLCCIILIDYSAALLMESGPARLRRLFLILSVTSNLAILGVFKYYNFAIDAVSDVLDTFGLATASSHWSLILPIGLSFHTFQSLSYTIEVYRGRWRAERHLGFFALYVMFYPQLVAGPIERPHRLLPQLRQTHAFDYDRVTSGLRLMLWGLFKKVVIADRLAVVVDHVYGDPTTYGPSQMVVATVAFAVQIYCDFSGYTDMALGAAEVMGFKLMKNFDSPYSSRSVTEFWHRWHISLSSWFRDYVYIPLGGNQGSTSRWSFNILVTFLLSGLWHGASWTFVVWGALHGAYILVERLCGGPWSAFMEAAGLRAESRLRRTIETGMTFAAICVAWVFFRARTVGEAFYIAKQLPVGVWSIATTMAGLPSALADVGVGRAGWMWIIAALMTLVAVHAVRNRYPDRTFFAATPITARWALYYGLIAFTVLGGRFTESKFIYFQF